MNKYFERKIFSTQIKKKCIFEEKKSVVHLLQIVFAVVEKLNF